MSKINTFLSSKIKKFLSDNNLSQKEFVYLLHKQGCDISQSGFHFWLTGEKEPRGEAKEILCNLLGISFYGDFQEVKMKNFPLLGKVACGKPIWTEEEKNCFVMADYNIKADFCLVCKGDSMEPLIKNGDVVFIKKQDTVRNGEIAVVIIDNEATLKRVYQKNNTFNLIAENKKYEPMIFTQEDIEAKSIKICGKAVFNQSLLY